MGVMVWASGEVPQGCGLTILAGDRPELMGSSSNTGNGARELWDMALIIEASLIS